MDKKDSKRLLKTKSKVEKKRIVIKATNINKKYRKKVVLKDLSLIVRQGDRLGLIAANGVGKSTFMEILAEIRKPTSGQVYLDPKAKLGFQFQESIYPFGITVKGMISFYLNIYRIKLTKEQLYAKLKFFEIEKLFKKQIVLLSGGEQQRLNLFLALCNNPDIWFLDEITTGLDIKFRTIILHYIDKLLTKDKTLLLVSHNAQEIDKLCDRLLVLDLKTTICNVSSKKVKEVFGSIGIFLDYFFHELDRFSPLKKRQIIQSYLLGEKKFIKTFQHED